MTLRIVLPALVGIPTRYCADVARAVAAMDSRRRGKDDVIDTLETEA